MRSTNRKRALLVSSSVILLCMAIIIGTTFALFTDTQTVKNHLQAGDLTISLKRTELLKTTLNADGYLVTPDEPDKTVVNFSNPTDENVFGIGDNEKIVPGTKYIAKMELENNSDVAFGYWIEIVCTDKTNGEDLAKQLKVTVDTGEAKTSFVNDGLLVGSSDSYVGEISVGRSQSFTVTVEFVDEGVSLENGVLGSENNAAKSENVDFDLIVYAVQLPEN